MLQAAVERRPQRGFTVDEFARFVEIGVIGEDEHVELLGGRIVEMAAKGPIHAIVVTELYDRLFAVFAGRASVRKEESLHVSNRDLPEPDLMVIRGRQRDYIARHPRGDETILVVEVAVSSLEEDRDKALVYARARVPVYWIVDVPGRRVIVHTGPLADGYARVEVVDESGHIECPETDVRWQVGDLIP